MVSGTPCPISVMCEVDGAEDPGGLITYGTKQDKIFLSLLSKSLSEVSESLSGASESLSGSPESLYGTS